MGPPIFLGERGVADIYQIEFKKDFIDVFICHRQFYRVVTGTPTPSPWFYAGLLLFSYCFSLFFYCFSLFFLLKIANLIVAQPAAPWDVHHSLSTNRNIISKSKWPLQMVRSE